MSPRLRAALGHAVVAATAAALLAALLPFGPFPLGVPFHYRGDAVLLAALVKGVAEDGLLHLSRIGAPFGTDIVDWPFGLWLPLAFTTAVVRLTGEAGLALNLLWLGATVLTAVSAAWAFGRLGHRPETAFVFGLAYAFLPYGFYRGVDPANLGLPLVPPLALLCLRCCGLAPEQLDPRERRLALAACALQGLCALYYSFFAVWLLLAGTAVGWALARRRDLARAGAAGLALLVLGAALPLVPSALHWQRHGLNQKLRQETVADADRHGLKLRQMLVPIDEHPLPPLRAAAARVAEARFPDEDENAGARLGTLGTLGLLWLLGFAAARAAGVAAADAALGPAAALTLAALLLAQVGGLGSLFNALLAPDVRGYHRIVVFVAFFALHAAAVLTGRLLARAPAAAGAAAAPAFRTAALALLGVAAVGDQLPRRFLADTRWSSAAGFAEDAAFVARLEALLPPGAMVFQLPHAAIPVDLGSTPPMAIHDPGRAYFHSRTLRWSWGAMLGRGGDWQTRTSRLPPAALARQAALAGFAGLWIDRWGYPEAGPRPWPALEAELAAAAGRPPIASAGGRYGFVPLDELGRRLRRELDPAALQAARAEALAPALPVPRGGEE